MITLSEPERGICLLGLIKLQHFWRYIDSGPWVNVPDEAVEAVIRKLGLPSDDEIILECPRCGWEYYVPVADYLLNAALGGAPFSCQNADHEAGVSLVPSTIDEEAHP